MPPGWSIAFVGTLLIELPVYLLTLRGKFRVLVIVGMVLAMNSVTHPVLWLAVPRFTSLGFGEACVWLFEGAAVIGAARTRLAMRKLTLTEALAPALAANAISTGIGIIIG